MIVATEVPDFLNFFLETQHDLDNLSFSSLKHDDLDNILRIVDTGKISPTALFQPQRRVLVKWYRAAVDMSVRGVCVQFGPS